MAKNKTLKFECFMQWLAGKNKAVRSNRGWELLSNTKYEQNELESTKHQSFNR